MPAINELLREKSVREDLAGIINLAQTDFTQFGLNGLGKPFNPEAIRVLAAVYTERMKVTCSKYKQHEDRTNPEAVSTDCHSGYDGQLRNGEQCLTCEAFCADFSPKHDNRTRASLARHLVQINAPEDKVIDYLNRGYVDLASIVTGRFHRRHPKQ